MKAEYNVKKLSEAIEGVKYTTDIVLGTHSSRYLAEREACPKVYNIKKGLYEFLNNNVGELSLDEIVILKDFGILAEREACPKVYNIKSLDEIVILDDFGIVEQDKRTVFHDRHEVNNARVLLCLYAEPVGDHSGNYNGVIRFMYNDDVKGLMKNYIEELRKSLINDKKVESIGESAGELSGN